MRFPVPVKLLRVVLALPFVVEAARASFLPPSGPAVTVVSDGKTAEGRGLRPPRERTASVPVPIVPGYGPFIERQHIGDEDIRSVICLTAILALVRSTGTSLAAVQQSKLGSRSASGSVMMSLS